MQYEEAFRSEYVVMRQRDYHDHKADQNRIDRNAVQQIGRNTQTEAMTPKPQGAARATHPTRAAPVHGARLPSIGTG